MGGSLDKKETEKAKKELGKCYNVKTMKEANYILKIKMERMKDSIDFTKDICILYA